MLKKPPLPVTAVTDVPRTGELTEVAAQPVSTHRSRTSELPYLAVALAAVLVASTGASAVVGLRTRRRLGARA
jgi:hypothetical protein